MNHQLSTLMPVLNPCILLVQTDETFAEQAKLDLQDAGYTPIFIPKASKAWSEFEVREPVLIVLDSTRAGEAGTKLCQKIRKSGSRVLILLIVEKETLEERVACLEIGADDYLPKPSHVKKLLERVHFYLQPHDTSNEQLRFGNLVLDLTTRRLLLDDKAIDLTLKEFELLKYLMSHPREVLTREQILENVWGYDFQGESNVIEVYIRYLRLKMEQGGQKRLIHTVRGIGYVLREG
jgi:DNA-binding response OmpR family regulator